MVKSMTGFGRGCYEEEDFSVTIEIKSVNHRYLDLSFRMPRNLLFLEDALRKRVKKGDEVIC